jgi:hypothetical protein
MTNNMIIFNAQQQLAEEGKIRYTGRTFTARDMEGNEIELKETEPIHTFQYWKALGFSVKKGEKAIAKLRIWKCSVKAEKLQAKNKDGEMVEITEDHKKMFMKDACFFSFAQVEKTGTPRKAVALLEA